MPAHHDLQSESEADKQATLLAAIGDPSTVAARLHQFRDTAQTLSSSQHELTAQYAKQWIALYQGQVVASGTEVQTVLQDLEAQQIPSADALIRFIDPTPQTLILQPCAYGSIWPHHRASPS